MTQENFTGQTGSAEIKAAMTGLLSDMTKAQTELKSKLSRTETRLASLERKGHFARPGLSTTAEADVPHKKAFSAYLRSGKDDAMRALDIEGKSLSTTVAGDGGYLVDPQTANQISSVLYATASLRAIANVVAVESTAFDVLVDHGDVGSGWANEATEAAESDTPQLDRISIPLHELSAMPKASQRLLDDSAFDVEGWLGRKIADKFSRAEAAAFVNGNGIDKPKGFLMENTAIENNWSWGTLGYVLTGADGDFSATDPANALIDLVYALGARYRANASFVMNSRTAGAVRKMRDGDGRFIWTEAITASEPSRLLGYPVVIVEDMPDIATGANAIAFGDFAQGYTIAERPDLRIMRDPFTAKPHVLFYATKRVGGAVTDFEAIKLLKFAF